MNKEKQELQKKSIIKNMFDEMKSKGYQANNKKDLVSFLKYNNEGREIYGVGVGLSIGLFALGINYSESFGLGYIIFAVALIVASLKGIFRIRTQESKILELIK